MMEGRVDQSEGVLSQRVSAPTVLVKRVLRRGLSRSLDNVVAALQDGAHARRLGIISDLVEGRGDSFGVRALRI